jgi:glycosyltransferase involved in cell wall biosynthesis
VRLHLLGLPHTETTKAYSWCAYTEKTRKLANMLTSLGHEVYLYGGEVSEADAINVSVVDRAWQAQYFGHYDWARDSFNDFDPTTPHWLDYNARCIDAIRTRMSPGDYLGLTMGSSQAPVKAVLPELVPVEVGIGYSGILPDTYRVFESHAWRHHLAGFYHNDNARFFDTVIPNSFEVDDFPLGVGDGGYYLFIGRLINRKGPGIAVETTKRIGAPLYLAGQGVVEREDAFFRGASRYKGIDVELSGTNIAHIGVVGPKRRAELMGAATAVFVPTTYLEPFGGVAVEAMLCGTPVITTDWGAFTETVRQGVTGFRCNTLAEFVDAAKSVGVLNREDIRTHALRYSTDVVRHEYDAYFRRLDTLKGKGWYAV